jgi:hypothetical protein
MQPDASRWRGDFTLHGIDRGIILALVMKILETRHVFVAILAVGLFTMAARSVTDPDVWWHLRTGQLMVQQHTIFHADPYSFTRAGQPWVDHEWLSQLLIFGIYRFTSWGGLIVAFALVTAASLLVVYVRCPGHPYVAGVMVVLGAFASAPTWGVRPQVLTCLLASLLLLLLEQSYQRPRLLWWTPAMTLLWVNLHAGYALGIGLMAAFLVGDALDTAFGFKDGPPLAGRMQCLLPALFACIAVVPLNPYGTAMYSYPLETLQSPAMQSYIKEWFSPNFHQYRFVPLMVMMLLTIALPVLSPKRLRPREVLLLCVTMYAALRSVRHIPIYALVAVPILSGLVQACLQEKGFTRWFGGEARGMTQKKILLNGFLLAGIFVFMLGRIRYLVQDQAAAEARKFPRAAASFLLSQRPAGPMLNHYNWGGYFIWKLYPQSPVYVDGRADLYGDTFINAFAATYYLQGDLWKDSLTKWGINTVILPPDAPLVTALAARSDWRTIYSDQQAVVLTKIH